MIALNYISLIFNSGSLRSRFFALITFMLLCCSGCNKINIKEPNAFSVKVFSINPKNTYAGYCHDLYGNIYTLENIADSDTVFIHKINPSGTELWRRPVSLPHAHIFSTVLYDIGTGLVMTLDTYIYINRGRNYTLQMLLDYEGNMKTVNKISIVRSTKINTGPNQDYMIYGVGNNAQDYPVTTLIKCDLNGNHIWEKQYPFGNWYNWGSYADIPAGSGFFTRDDGFVVYGNNSTPFPNFLVHRVDAGGNILWIDTVYTSDIDTSLNFVDNLSVPDYTTGICELNDGSLGFLVHAQVYNNFIETQTYGVIMDKNGKNIKAKNLNFVTGPSNVSFGGTPDNGFYVGALSTDKGNVAKNNLTLEKFDAGFNALFTRSYGGFFDLNGGVLSPYINGGYLIGMSTNAFGNGLNNNQVCFMIVDMNGMQ